MNDRPQSSGVSQPHATRVRYLIVSVVTLMAVLLYLHRYCLSFAERYITEDLHLTNDQAAWLLSAFFWTYALAQVPAGWLGDRFGVRLMLALYILFWSLCTGLIGAVAAFGVLLALRFGTGLGQAGAYPTSAALLSDWVPLGRRGLASSIVSNGGRLGGAIAPVLTAYLIVAFVPADTPARLEPGDLLNAHRLWADLRHPGNTPAGAVSRRVLELLPAPALDVVRADEMSPDGPHVLLNGLNEVLRARGLAQPEDLEALPLPREALELARRPRDQLSEMQVVRLNRLLLEAAFRPRSRNSTPAAGGRCSWCTGSRVS